MIPLVPVFILVSGGLWTATFVVESSNQQIAFVYLGIIVLSALVRSSVDEAEALDWYLLPIALLGPLGVIAATTTYITGRFHSIEGEQLKEWYEELRGGPDAVLPRNFANDVSLGRISPQASASIRSAVEIFREGTFQDRQKVLLWIARRKDPALKSLLEHAIRCDDTIIRSQAASLIVHFESTARSRPAE